MTTLKDSGEYPKPNGVVGGLIPNYEMFLHDGKISQVATPPLFQTKKNVYKTLLSIKQTIFMNKKISQNHNQKWGKTKRYEIGYRGWSSTNLQSPTSQPLNSHLVNLFIISLLNPKPLPSQPYIPPFLLLGKNLLGHPKTNSSAYHVSIKNIPHTLREFQIP